MEPSLVIQQIKEVLTLFKTKEDFRLLADKTAKEMGRYGYESGSEKRGDLLLLGFSKYERRETKDYEDIRVSKLDPSSICFHMLDGLDVTPKKGFRQTRHLDFDKLGFFVVLGLVLGAAFLLSSLIADSVLGNNVLQNNVFYRFFLFLDSGNPNTNIWLELGFMELFLVFLPPVSFLHVWFLSWMIATIKDYPKEKTYRKKLKEYEKNPHDKIAEANTVIQKEAENLSLQRAIDEAGKTYRPNIFDYYYLEEAHDYFRKKYKDALSKYKALSSSLEIADKYKEDIVALSSFVDYFESSRCKKLSGPNGCIDTYESEKLRKRILSRLEEIQENLDSVSNYQYTIGRVLQNIHTNLDSVSKYIDSNLKIWNPSAESSSYPLLPQENLLSEARNRSERQCIRVGELIEEASYIEPVLVRAYC